MGAYLGRVINFDPNALIGKACHRALLVQTFVQFKILKREEYALKGADAVDFSE